MTTFIKNIFCIKTHVIVTVITGGLILYITSLLDISPILILKHLYIFLHFQEPLIIFCYLSHKCCLI